MRQGYLDTITCSISHLNELLEKNAEHTNGNEFAEGSRITTGHRSSRRAKLNTSHRRHIIAQDSVVELRRERKNDGGLVAVGVEASKVFLESVRQHQVIERNENMI